MCITETILSLSTVNHIHIFYCNFFHFIKSLFLWNLHFSRERWTINSKCNSKMLQDDKLYGIRKSRGKGIKNMMSGRGILQFLTWSSEKNSLNIWYLSKDLKKLRWEEPYTYLLVSSPGRENRKCKVLSKTGVCLLSEPQRERGYSRWWGGKDKRWLRTL